LYDKSLVATITVQDEFDQLYADNLHCKDKNQKFSKQIFPEKEYRGLIPNFHIHVSVSDLYIPTFGLPILLEEICRSWDYINRSQTNEC
jgi:hypothetical protein